MRIVIIGGSGHVGTYLVPMLVERGHSVINVTRGSSQPYLPNAAWQNVAHVKVDRDHEDSQGAFGRLIRDLKPDVVIDMICFTLSSAQQIVEALRGEVQHFIHCGTIWVYGHSTVVPATEDQPCYPISEYGIQKAAIQAYLLQEARLRGFPATVLQPGHIVGPGYVPLNPAANFNPAVYEQIGRGEELTLPNFGLETIHHVHARDVAQLFLLAITNWSTSVGENFHAVSPAAITLRGYAEAMYRWFGHEPKLKFLGWEQWKTTVSERDAESTLDHIARSPNASIDKARRLLGYQPAYSSLQAIQESVRWLVDNGKLSI